MALYRIFRMKDHPRQQFRWAPHVGGSAAVKPRDYEPRGEVEAINEYEAWQKLRESQDPLLVGDVLETLDGQLRICKYVGFEPAEWALPDPKHAPEPETIGQPIPPQVPQEAPYA